MNELETLRELAKGRGQISAAVAAEVKRGELMGYYVQRRENSNVVYTMSDTPMSKEEWHAAYCASTPSRGARSETLITNECAGEHRQGAASAISVAGSGFVAAIRSPSLKK
jgi:hypothetical protein